MFPKDSQLPPVRGSMKLLHLFICDLNNMFLESSNKHTTDEFKETVIRTGFPEVCYLLVPKIAGQFSGPSVVLCSSTSVQFNKLDPILLSSFFFPCRFSLTCPGNYVKAKV